MDLDYTREEQAFRETVAQDPENAPKAFIGLLKGQNFGKQPVKLI